MVAWTRTRTAISPSPNWSKVADTVTADAPASATASIMASVISGMWYPPWFRVMDTPDTVTTFPAWTAAIRSGSLLLSRKAKPPRAPFCRYTFFPLR